ncbi:thioredoxin family protein [Nocardioides sp. KR10-350]|uniref:thioredoxin family protein n=1 Tax=Nocardioides cheoyonin TaxID=3156615 RepID=UPI0032B312F8
MSTGLWIAVAAVVLAVGFGLYRALTDGRFRRPAQSPTWDTLAEAAGVRPGERATLVQFSSAFCAPCRVTRRVLADVADSVPGVVHVDIDAEQHLDVVRRLGILRTPTTLVLDAGGNEVARAAGAPRKEQVLGALPGEQTAS